MKEQKTRPEDKRNVEPDWLCAGALAAFCFSPPAYSQTAEPTGDLNFQLSSFPERPAEIQTRELVTSVEAYRRRRPQAEQKLAERDSGSDGPDPESKASPLIAAPITEEKLTLSQVLNSPRRIGGLSLAGFGIALDAMAMVAALSLNGTRGKVLAAFTIGVGITHALEPKLGFIIGRMSEHSPLLIGTLHIGAALAMGKIVYDEVSRVMKGSKDQLTLDQDLIHDKTMRYRRSWPLRALAELPGLNKAVKALTYGLALAGPLQAVSNDALVNGFAQYPVLADLDRGAFIAASTAVGVEVLACVLGTWALVSLCKKSLVSLGAKNPTQELEGSAAREGATTKIAEMFRGTFELGTSIFTYFAARSAFAAFSGAFPEILSPGLSSALPWTAAAGALLYLRTGNRAARSKIFFHQKAKQSLSRFFTKRRESLLRKTLTKL